MKKFEEEVKRPSNAGIDPFSKRDVSFEKLSIKFTKGAQTLKEWKEYAFKAEDRIRELESQLDSQQPEIPGFEEEFDNLMRAFVDYHDCFDFDTEKCYLELKKEFIEKYGKKQQPEIPEVPQFVADWLDRKPLYAINGSIPVEIIEWSKKQTGYADLGMNINLLLKLKVNGYTVAKEKRFYLKNKLTGLYLAIDSSTYIEIEEKWLDAKRITSYKPFFTQSQIETMETGSYEQIEVSE